MPSFRYALLALILGAIPAAHAQSVIVNELLASNDATAADPDFAEFGDWIELYNPTGATVDLGGYFLSDDFDEPTRWRIPDGVTLAPGAFLVVWTDDHDAGPPTTTALHTDFKLSGGGEQVGLFDPTGAVVDAVVFGDQETDISYGRYPDGGDWRFATPTPGAPNAAGIENGPLATPTASLDSGFYDGGESVVLEAEAGATIRYTLDGSPPTETSPAYAEPFTLDATTVLRAAAFAPDRAASAPLTRTFFVGETSTLPVISLVTDPAGFFSDTSGIYVEGTNGITGRCRDVPVNWNQDWERETQFTFFEPDGAGGFTVALDQGAGVAIFGGCSRIYPQKSLELHARSQYGASDFAYRFFDDVDIDSFDDLVLRSSAQDWWRTMFRDGMIQTLVSDMDVDRQAYRPTIVFLNGAYWGIHNLREKLNEDWVAGHTDFDDDEVEILDAQKVSTRGLSEHYDGLLAILDGGDMNDSVTFAEVEARMDVDEYLNYLIAEIYSANADWPGNNLKLWRPTTPDGRWRWMLYDLDFGFGGNSQGQTSSNTLALATATNGPDWPNPPWSTYLFRKLLENDGFRHTFIQRLAAHMVTTFDAGRVVGVIDSLQTNIAAEIPRHKARWPKSISFGSSWDELVDVMRTFARGRAVRVRGHVYDQFAEVSGAARLWVGVSGPGQVVAESVPMPRATPDDPFGAVFFRNVPVRLVAVPDEGYVFAGWSGLADAAGDTISVVLTDPAAASITARFALGVDTEPTATPDAFLSPAYPNPTSGTSTVDVSLARSGPLSVRVVDMLGREVATLADGPATAGTHHLTLDGRALPGGVYTIVMEAEGRRQSRRVVVVR